MSHITSYEILACSEIWNCDTDSFSHRVIIFHHNEQYFLACDPQRKGPVDQTQLHLEPIPFAHFRAPFAENYTLAPETHLQDEQIYIKEPQLIDYGMSSPSEREAFYEPQLQEVQVYELLRLKPHPNIGFYHGCIVKDNRIRGLSLRRYHRTLKDVISDKALSCDQRLAFLEDIKRGVAHLHSLGFVHGDLNPSNVMLDGGRAVVVDFDSCRPVGMPMGRKGGTWGWCSDALPDGAELEHDEAALGRLEQYLLGGSNIEDEK